VKMFSIFFLIFIVTAEGREIFNVQKEDLENAQVDLLSLQKSLKTDGAFVVSGVSRSYTRAVKELRETARDCFNELRFPATDLADGSKRTTFATNVQNFYPHCIQASSSAISEEFDSAFSLVAAAIEELTGQASLEWREAAEGKTRRFNTLPHKDHIHVYETIKGSRKSEDEALPFHVDSGVLLMLTPSIDLPVQIRGSDGVLIYTSRVSDDSIIFIVARGLTDWLLQGSPAARSFFPAPHAVPSLSGKVDSRTVFARMKVAPETAIPLRLDDSVFSFEEVFQEKKLRSSGVLCPSELTVSKKLPGSSCETGSAECWMSCLLLPECSGDDYYICTNLVGQPCCNEYNSPPPDPNLDVPGNCHEMDTSCHWKCYADFLKN